MHLKKDTHKKITINDVAERAGVSAMTVSRVIRNKGSLAQKTRDHVKDVIKELGYEPLSSARNLSGSYSRTIGIVIPSYRELRQFRHGYEYEYALLVGALNVCNHFDYSVNLIEIRNHQDAERLIKKIRSRQIGGYVVAAPVTEYEDLLKTLQEQEIVFSTISACNPEYGDLVVTANEQEATRIMVNKMLDLGHRKMAFIGGAENHRATRERQAGYLAAIKNHPDYASIQHQILDCGIFYENGYQAGIDLLSRSNRPTAVQCLTDDIAAGIISAANSLAMDLPADLSICGFDNFGLARKISPSLTTAVLPAEEMAENAVLQVIDALEGKTKRKSTALGCDVIFRQSIAGVASS
jgi:LacI family transcriptional regulator